MTKSTIWKLIFIFGILLVSFSLISPFEDRELGEYAEAQAGTTADPAQYPDHVSFSGVTAGIRAGLEEDQPIDFESLRNYGKENKLDYSAYFQPPEGVLNTIFSRLFPFWINPRIRAGPSRIVTSAMTWCLELCLETHKPPSNLAWISVGV